MCVCMCVCVLKGMYARMYVCVYARMHACMYVCIFVYNTNTSMHGLPEQRVPSNTIQQNNPQHYTYTHLIQLHYAFHFAVMR